jgi:outer membrane protein assembly factor BamB
MLAGLILAGVMTDTRAADWPQWRGPQRNGISAETGWLSQWPSGGPRKVWGAQLGEGWSAVSVVGNKLYTAGNTNGRDTVFCLNSETGKPVWTYGYPCPTGDYGGPRATPVIDGGKVYMMSRKGGVVCLNATTGKVVWGRDVARELGADEPQWGFASSPLIEGNLAIFNIGGSGTALDKSTGRIVWKSGGTAGYASPVAANLSGQRAILIFSEAGLVAVNPTNGQRLWDYGWQTPNGVNAADPQFAGSDVFISSNYGTGCALLRTGGGRPSVIWQNRSMKNHFNSSVITNGGIFGNDENTLRCLDLRTGNERWNLRGMGKGGLVAADGKLIYLTERGELVISSAVPDRYHELARARVLNSNMCWTHPVLANGRIYCRSHEGELVCLDVKR